jgi:hypothetical protein
VLAIADRFGLPPERALAILDNPDVLDAPEPLHYPLPAELAQREPLYSTSATASHVYWRSWSTKVALVLMLGAMGLVSQRLLGNQYRAVLLFFACIPLAAWLYLRLENLWDRLFLWKTMKRRIGARILHGSGSVFVGLVPGGAYPVSGNSVWDLGFLSFTPEWLTYNGERAQFSVPRSSVSSISVRPGPAAWDRTHGVVIQHEGGAFILRTSDLGYTQRVARKLETRLATWWRGAALPGLESLDPPFPPPSLPVVEDGRYPARWRLAMSFGIRAAMLFGGTLLVLACGVPMNAGTVMFSLVPFTAPLAYLLAVCPMLLRRG